MHFLCSHLVAFEISLPEQHKVFYKITDFLMCHIGTCTQTLVFSPSLPGFVEWRTEFRHLNTKIPLPLGYYVQK
jgi:hypothetical protein